MHPICIFAAKPQVLVHDGDQQREMWRVGFGRGNLVGMLASIRTFGFLMLAGAAGAMAQTPQVVGVGNFSHVVENLDRSVAFYRDVLQMEVTTMRGEFSGNPQIMKMAGTVGGESRMAVLKAPDVALGVELLEYRKLDRKAANPHFFDPGAANLIARVKDLDGTFVRAIKSGARVITEAGAPVLINERTRVVFVQDPDGFVVEISQADPESAAAAKSNVVSLGFEVSIVDTDKTVAFYKDVLPGLTAGAEFNTNQMMAATAGASGAKFRQSRANIPGTKLSMTFIEFQGIPRIPIQTRPQDPGTAILQLQVNDVDAFTKMLKTAGAKVVSAGGAPVELAPGRKIALLRDLNNLFLEIMPAPAAE
jgi:glyoxylase I family protein